MNERRLVKRYSSGLSRVMMFRARELLISSMSAASVVDLPQPVGPEITARPLSASTSLRRSGCRLRARRSLTDGASSRTAMAMPRMVRKRLIRHRMPATAMDTSAEPRSRKCVQASLPRSSWLTAVICAAAIGSPTAVRSPRIRTTSGVPDSRCRSLAPSSRPFWIQSLSDMPASADLCCAIPCHALREASSPGGGQRGAGQALLLPGYY